MSARQLPFAIVVRAPESRMEVTVPPLMESLEMCGVPPGAATVTTEDLCATLPRLEAVGATARWVLYLPDAAVAGERFLQRAGDVYRLVSEAPAASRVACATLGAGLPFGLYDTEFLRTLGRDTPDEALAGRCDRRLGDAAPQLMGDFRYREDDDPLTIEWYPSLDVYRFVPQPPRAVPSAD